MPRAALSQDQVDEFRDALCAAATRLFAEKGYAGVTMRALARDLGCSPMTPYRYFENKDAILLAVRTKAFVRHGARSEKVAAEVPDPIERLRAYGRAYIQFALDEPNAYRIMFALSQNADLDFELLTDPERRLEVLRGWSLLVDVLGELVDTGQAEGDPVELAHMAWTMLHGLVSLELSNKLQLGRSLDQLIEPALDHFLRGIGAPPTSSPSGASHEPPSLEP